MLALVIMDSRMTLDEKSEEGLRSWPCAMYTAVSWGAAFYLLGVMRDAAMRAMTCVCGSIERS